MKHKTFDYLIIGGGLAGCFLSRNLRSRGRSVCCVDSAEQSASLVAGALINPITGKRFGQIVNYDEYYAVAREAYTDIGSIFRALPILRILSASDEQQHWSKKSVSLSAGGSVREIDEATALKLLPAEFRRRESDPVLYINDAAIVDTNVAVTTMRSSLEREGAYFKSNVSAEDLEIHNLEFNGFHFDRVVFCDGWKMSANKHFAFVPPMQAKGHVLTLKFKRDPKLQSIVISHGKFLAPLADGWYRFGSSYDWNFTHNELETNAVDFLLSALAEVIDADVESWRADCGVRPIVADLKAVLGVHPLHPKLFIFNGLGSRGALLAPSYARLMTDYLEDCVALPDEINVSRFYKHYHA